VDERNGKRGRREGKGHGPLLVRVSVWECKGRYVPSLFYVRSPPVSSLFYIDGGD